MGAGFNAVFAHAKTQKKRSLICIRVGNDLSLNSFFGKSFLIFLIN